MTKYTISKLARKIANELELATVEVWDFLDELGYETQDLTEKEYQRYKNLVSKKLVWKL